MRFMTKTVTVAYESLGLRLRIVPHKLSETAPRSPTRYFATRQVCKTDFELEPEEGSCVYVKKEIGEGRPCDGNIFEAGRRVETR